MSSSTTDKVTDPFREARPAFQEATRNAHTNFHWLSRRLKAVHQIHRSRSIIAHTQCIEKPAIDARKFEAELSVSVQKGSRHLCTCLISSWRRRRSSIDVDRRRSSSFRQSDRHFAGVGKRRIFSSRDLVWPCDHHPPHHPLLWGYQDYPMVVALLMVVACFPEYAISSQTHGIAILGA